MKTMTCKQLGGTCELEFEANSFDEIAEMSKRHGMEMFQKGDKAHLKTMIGMKAKMQSPNDMVEWLESKRKVFDSLPDNE